MLTHKNHGLILANNIVGIDNNTVALFHFDGHLISTNGLAPADGAVYTLRDDGKFNGAVEIEESTTNLFSVTDISKWGKDGSGQSVLGTVTVQDDGSIFIQDTASNTRFAQYNVPLSVNNSYTLSVKYKRGTGTPTFKWHVEYRNNSNTVVTRIWSNPPADIGDWQNLSFTFSFTDSTITKANIFFQDGNDYTTYTHSYYLNEPQLEQKAYSTSFINGTRASQVVKYPTAGLLNKDGPWTISCWGKSNTPTGYFRFLFDAWSKFYIALNTSSVPRISWVDSTQKAAEAASAITNINGWHHWAYVYDKVNSKLYVDGIKVIDAVSNLSAAMPEYFQIAGWSDYPWNGLIDELRIDNVARTDDEILLWYLSEAPFHTSNNDIITL